MHARRLRTALEHALDQLKNVGDEETVSLVIKDGSADIIGIMIGLDFYVENDSGVFTLLCSDTVKVTEEHFE